MSASPPPPPRRTTPGLGTPPGTAGLYHVRPHEDEDTNPGTPAANEARRRISYTSSDEEIRILDGIIRAWGRMSADRKMLIAALCRELDPLP